MDSFKFRYVYLALAIMLVLCLLPMPYGYYVLVRFTGMVAFAFMAYRFFSSSNMPLGVLFGALAVLFQPFVKMALGRGIWNIVDVLVAILLVFLWGKEEKKW